MGRPGSTAAGPSPSGPPDVTFHNAGIAHAGRSPYEPPAASAYPAASLSRLRAGMIVRTPSSGGNHDIDDSDRRGAGTAAGDRGTPPRRRFPVIRPASQRGKSRTPEADDAAEPGDAGPARPVGPARTPPTTPPKSPAGKRS